MWWPDINKQIEETIQKCLVCCHHCTPQRAEPLLPTTFPDYPWQKVEADLFTFKGSDYFPIMWRCLNYISDSNTTYEIHLCLPWSTRNFNFSPQFSSDVFTQFAKDFDFQHQTSCPNFPQSNGERERAVKTVKVLLEKASDPYICKSAVLSYDASCQWLLTHRVFSKPEIMIYCSHDH